MTTRPNLFVRGNAFSHTFDVPPAYADGTLANWLPLAQARVADNRLPEGLIVTLDHAWVDPTVARKIRVTTPNTEHWPVGLFEVDVLLTSPSGDYARLPKLVMECVPGVTIVVP